MHLKGCRGHLIYRNVIPYAKPAQYVDKDFILDIVLAACSRNKEHKIEIEVARFPHALPQTFCVDHLRKPTPSPTISHLVCSFA